MTLSQTSYKYDGTPKKPAVTVMYGNKKLTEGVDYSLIYKYNQDPGTARVMVTGMGNYNCTTTKYFTIESSGTSAVKENIANYELTISTSTYKYDGTAKKPQVAVKKGNKKLTKGTDYTVTYSNNVNVGTATVTVTGIGNYYGTLSKTYTIKK